MPFRFIHTADLHLDSPLKSLALRNEALSEVVSNATRQVLVRIVNLCIEEKVNALLIAGDLYDGNQTSMKTARFLAAQLRRLSDANVSVYIIRGNHDAESKITRELSLPDSVHVFSSKAEVVEFKAPDAELQQASSQKSTPIMIHGVSFKTPHAPSSLLPNYKPPVPLAINIGMMHTSLDGSSMHDPYAPCSLSDLHNHGFDYWALGHIHKRATHSTEQCTVVMPGIPQGRDIGETGKKTVTLVSISDDQRVEIEEHALAVAQFETINVTLDQTHDWQTVIDLVISRLAEATETINADHLVARVFLNGTTPLAWRLQRDADLLVNELESRLEDNHHHWLDKLIINCEPAETDTNNSDSGPQTELANLMVEEINKSSNLISEAKQTMDAIFKTLPSELRSKFGTDEEALENTIKSLALSGSKLITANLADEHNTDEQTLD